MATKDYASWSEREVERFLKLSTPDRQGQYEKTAEQVAKSLGRSRFAIQSMRRKLVKARKLAGGSHKRLVTLLLVGEHRLARLKSATIPERSTVGGYSRAGGAGRTGSRSQRGKKIAVHGYARKLPAARGPRT
jgi:hypothetical protein